MPAARPLRRRTVVVAGLAATGLAATTAAGCGIVERVPEPRPRRDDEDDAVVRRARVDQERLLRSAVATVDAHPGLAATLTPLVEHHRAHVSVLGGEPGEVAPEAGSAGTPSPSASPTDQAPTVPGTPAAALAALRTAESAASSERGADAVASASGDLARVLAAMAAGQAQHVVVLDAAARALAGGGG